MSTLSEIKKIYQESFPSDSPEFVEMFFKRVYKPEDTMVHRLGNGEAVSSLFLQRFKMNFAGLEVPVGYISAVATRKQYRGQGFMKLLMAHALEASYMRGDMFAALIPAQRWLYNYYDKFGFSTVFYIEELRYTPLHKFEYQGKYVVEDDILSTDVYNCFNKILHNRKRCIQYSFDDYLTLVEDNRLDGGSVVAIRNIENGEVAGIGFAVESSDHLTVREIAAIDSDARLAILAEMVKLYPELPVTVINCPDENSVYPIESRAMARIINVESVLKVLAAESRDIKMAMKITDRYIKENNHTYIIDNGSVVVNDGYKGKLDLDVKVDVLSSILFSSEKVGRIFNLPTGRPYMPLMLE